MNESGDRTNFFNRGAKVVGEYSGSVVVVDSRVGVEVPVVGGVPPLRIGEGGEKSQYRLDGRERENERLTRSWRLQRDHE